MQDHATASPIDLHSKLIAARAAHQQGQIDLDTLYAVADEYIAALRAYKRRTGRRLSIPSRAYIIRAV